MNCLAYLVTLVVVFVASVRGATIRSSTTDCTTARDPTDLQEQWGSYLSGEHLHESLYFLPPREQLISSDLQKGNGSMKYWMYGNDQCPSSFSDLDGAGTKAERSICPHHFEVDEDQSRFPKQLYTAKCNCQNCLGMTSSDARCEPMYYNVRVLRKTNTCTNGLFDYEEGWHRLTVGCSCVKMATGSGPL